ncbi:hypothetical protein [Haloferax larsenii]|uniref:Uncharacterized protein n=1 Tax=Haloferax larsenii TaxID=302484 RepID=A0ABY5RKY3_HALLR|nr:hypothetical protein [Haloferax larsenii]UVE52073.1 hypothetical protein KU306_17340 [Haloferax larsenii]
MVLAVAGWAEPVVVVDESLVFDTTSEGVFDESDGVDTELSGYRADA